MADLPGRGSLRPQRVGRKSGSGSGSGSGSSSRASSRHPSAFLDDSRQAPGTHPLRSASSRFSLNEQFAATRREYELWDDDASSIFEKATTASVVEEEEEEEGDDDDDDDNNNNNNNDGDEDDEDGDELSSTVDDDISVIGTAHGMAVGSSEQPDWDYYDILCLPRDSELSQDDVRRAYYRLFFLFHPDSYPEHLRPLARLYFLLVQEAFEALIDPTRRARYDVSQSLEDADQVDASGYEAAFGEAVWKDVQSGVRTSSDLCLRVDASRVGGGFGYPQWRPGRPLKLLDYAFSQSAAVQIPALRRALQPKVTRLESLLAPNVEKGDIFQPSFDLGTPTLAVCGSVYGVAGDLSRIPSRLLFDRYQPLLPPTISRQRLIQLVEKRLAPLLSFKFHQEIRNRSYVPSLNEIQWLKSVIELEADVLPEQSFSSRVYHHITLPKTPEPTVLEANIRSTRRRHTAPRISLAVHQNFAHGKAYVRADSGDWATEPCRFLPELPAAKGSLTPAEFPFIGTPSVEVGFQTSSPERAVASSFSELPSGESGICGLDHELNACTRGSWTVSAAATTASVAGFLRFSKDIGLSPSASSPSSNRVEVELCSTAWQDRYLALRNLWSVGRFTRFGIELGVSPQSLHLSVYWSRLGQRLSLPLLIAPSAATSLFCAAAVPFASLAAVQILLNRRRGRRSEAAVSKASTPLSIARHRYEADNLAVLLAKPVEARQMRQASIGGLVILSAKFGVPDAHGNLYGEEIADVTVALAALVDGNSEISANTATRGEGRLTIPRGVRKGRIPGFWDPAPGREKVLRVHYAWKGKEAVMDSRGREELILPPQGG